MSNQHQGNFIESAEANSQGEIVVAGEQEDDSNVVIEYHQSDPIAAADEEDNQEGQQQADNSADAFPLINNEPFLNEETLNGIYGLLRLNTADMFDEVNLRSVGWKDDIDGILKSRLDVIHKKLEILSSIYQDNIPTNQMHHIEKIMSIFKSKQKEIYISKIPRVNKKSQCSCDHPEVSGANNHGHAHHLAESMAQKTQFSGEQQQQQQQQNQVPHDQQNQKVEESHKQGQEKQEEQEEECEIKEHKTVVNSHSNDQDEEANENGQGGEETTTATGVDSEDIDEEEAELRRLKAKLSENEKIREEQEEQRRVLIAQNMKLKAEYSDMLEKNRRLRDDFNNRVSLENSILRREVSAVHGNGIDIHNEQSGEVEGEQMESSNECRGTQGDSVNASSTTTAAASMTSTEQNSRSATAGCGTGAGPRAGMVGISMHDVQSILSMEFVDLKKCRSMDPVDNSITFDLNENYSIRIKSCEEVKYDRSSMCANVPHFIFKDNVFPFLSSVELFRIRGVSPEWREMVRDVWHKTFKRDMQEQLLATDLCKEIEAQCCLMHIRNPFYQKLNVLLMAMVEVINWEEFELKATLDQLSFKEKKIIVALTRVIGAPAMQGMLPFAEYENINQIEQQDFGTNFTMDVVMKLQEMLYAAIQGQNLPSSELKKIYTSFLMSADVSASSMANDCDKNVIILILIAKQFFLFALLKNFFQCSSAFLHSAKAKLDSLSKDWPTSKGFLEGAYRILLLRNVTIKKVPGKQGQIVMKEERKKKRKAGTGKKIQLNKEAQDGNDVEDLKEKEDLQNEAQGGRVTNEQGVEDAVDNEGDNDDDQEDDDDDDDEEEEEDEQQSENDVARLMKSIFNINKEVSEEPDIVIKRKSATLKVFLDQGTKLDIILNTVISLGLQNMSGDRLAGQQADNQQELQQTTKLSEHRQEQPKMSSHQFNMPESDETNEQSSQGSSSIEELEVKFAQNKEHIESMKQKSKQIQDSLMEQKNRLEAIEKRCKEQLAQFRTFDSTTTATIHQHQ